MPNCRVRLPRDSWISSVRRGIIPKSALCALCRCRHNAHWSGHEKRLNRETLNKSRRCSHEDEHYAREELIAEIGSMMLAAERGIPHDPSQHTAYVASWLQALKKDKNEIFRAAAAASKATDYILALEQGKAEEPAITEEVSGPHSQRALDLREEPARSR